MSNVVHLPDRTGYATDFNKEIESLDALELALRYVGYKWPRVRIVEFVKQLEAQGFKIVRKP